MYKKLYFCLIAGMLMLNKIAAEEKNTEESSFEERLEKIQFDEEKYPIPEIVLGKEDARYTLTIYSSFSCSHCKLLHKTLPRFIQEHVDNGDVRLTLRFYVDDHAAFEAAMLVVYFGQGKPDDMLKLVKLVYDNQEKWIQSKNQPEFIRRLFADFMQKRYPKNKNYWYQQVEDLLTVPNPKKPEIEKISQAINARLMHGHQYATKMNIFSVPALLFNIRVKDGKIVHGRIHEGTIPFDELWENCKKYDNDVSEKTKKRHHRRERKIKG